MLGSALCCFYFLFLLQIDYSVLPDLRFCWEISKSIRIYDFIFLLYIAKTKLKFMRNGKLMIISGFVVSNFAKTKIR